MPNFVNIDFTQDRQALLDLVTANLAAKGWTPEPEDPEVIFAEAVSVIAEVLADAQGQVPPAIFRKYGTDLQGVPYQPGIPATAFVTVTADAVVAGTDLTIPAGTQFELGDGFYFEAVDDIVIPVGSSSVTGQELRAILPGAGANGLTGSAQPVSQLAHINAVTIEGAAGGGADEEDDEGYQDRLRDELTLSAPRPITASDFAVFSRSVPNIQVGRSTAIDGYDAVLATTGNERTVTVFVTAEDGTALDTTSKNAILAYLQDRREVNFVIYVRDASYNTIDVTYTVKPYEGFDPAALIASVDAAIENFLSPLTWGVQGQNQGRTNADWSNETVVRYNKLIGVIEAVNGVDYVGTLTIEGAAANFTMTGPAPLPQAGTVSGTAL